MSIRTLSISVATAALVIFAGAAPSQALTMQECSAKYKAAKSANALNGMKWNDFRKAECAAGASALPNGGTTNSGTSNAGTAIGNGTAANNGTTTTTPGANGQNSAIQNLLGELGLGGAAGAGAATAARPGISSGTVSSIQSGNAVFPAAISQQYSQQSPGKARMLTCLDQYRANKANGGNGGMNWIEKGGGYYSQCNKRLNGG